MIENLKLRSCLWTPLGCNLWYNHASTDGFIFLYNATHHPIMAKPTTSSSSSSSSSSSLTFFFDLFSNGGFLFLFASFTTLFLLH